MRDSQIPDEAVKAMKRALCSEWRLEDKPDEVWIPEEEMDRACVDALTAAYPHLMAEVTRLRAKLDAVLYAAAVYLCEDDHKRIAAALDEEGT